MASDRSDDIDHLDFEIPSDLERQFAAPAAPAEPAVRREEPRAREAARPELLGDDDDDDGPTRLPSYRRRRAIMFLVALVLLVALFLSSGILSLFRQAPAPSDDGDRTVNASDAVG
jgi:hypothetical protein